MIIGLPEALPGDMLLFRGEGFLFQVLSRVLKVFEPTWDRWGWHVGFFVETKPHYVICEATRKGVGLSYPDNREFRIYRWLDSPPPGYLIKDFVAKYLVCKYDVLLYFWTGVFYLFRHFWNKPIPRLLDDRFTCWELVTEFWEAMGKAIISKYDCPVVTDILKALGESPQIKKE